MPERVGQAISDRLAQYASTAPQRCLVPAAFSLHRALERFGTRFSDRLGRQRGRGGTKVFSGFAQELAEVLRAEIPQLLAEWAMDCLEAAARPSWAYLFFSRQLCAAMDTPLVPGEAKLPLLPSLHSLDSHCRLLRASRNWRVGRRAGRQEDAAQEPEVS